MSERRDFDAVASEWDEHPPRVKLLGDIANSLLSAIVLTPEMDLLDFGCGTGLMSLHLASRVASLTGVDNSAAMLEVFLQKADRLELSNVRTLHCDLDQGDILSGQYDLIVSSMAFHHIQNIGLVLHQLYAALKPTGCLCIADLDLDDGLFHKDPTGVFHSGFDRDALASELKKVGFKEVETMDAASTTKPVGEGERTFTIFFATGTK